MIQTGSVGVISASNCRHPSRGLNLAREPIACKYFIGLEFFLAGQFNRAIMAMPP
jgi:hypothetical protein